MRFGLATTTREDAKPFLIRFIERLWQHLSTDQTALAGELYVELINTEETSTSETTYDLLLQLATVLRQAEPEGNRWYHEPLFVPGHDTID